jgi:glycosyltransferase involved in cell wall biosynthesis
MALRRPVVATAVDGLPEVVEDGQTGRLVPPGDAAGLAAAILELVGDRELRSKLGNQGRRRVETRFTVRAMIAAHEALYERLLGGPRARSADLRRAA